MKNRPSLIKSIQFWGIAIILMIGGAIIALDIIDAFRDINQQAAQMRAAHMDRQKAMIKREVERVVDMIRHEIAQNEALTRAKIKTRVYEACAIAWHIYRKNKGRLSRRQIEEMIVEALRPIRFENHSGYYFATRLDGVEVLFADKPEMEGRDMLPVRDADGRYVVQDMIDIAKRSGEGYYAYQWSKPELPGDDFKKISFIKWFEPFDWFIGTGLYVDDVEAQIRNKLLAMISQVRFGKEGYIFVNRLNGDALVSNGKRVEGRKKLWQVFNRYPEKTKALFQKEVGAAQKPDGDFIHYSLIKLTDPTKESPKVSFIYGIPELQWLVGAGVYLDDVETDIALMRQGLTGQIREKVFYSSLIVAGIVFFFIVLFNRLNHRLKNDFNLFMSFFHSAARSDEPIDRQQVQFDELDRLAENANTMLGDKIHARQALLDEREQLFVTIRSIGDGVITTDTSGRVMLINRVAEQLTGWTAEQARKRPLDEVFAIIHAQTRAPAPNPVARVLETGDIVDLANHTILVSRDGVEYQIADSAAPITDAAGKITGVVLVFRDVTREYRMRQSLAQSEANLRTVFEAAKNVAFVKIDSNEKDLPIIEFSPGAEHIFGYAPREVIGQSISRLFLPGEARAFPEVVEAMRESRSDVSGESSLVKKSGHTFPALYTSCPVFGNDGAMVSVICVFIDITQRKRAELELQKMDRLKSVGTLAGGIAHDFNNILMTLFGNIAMAREDLPADHPAYRSLEEAGSAMNRAIRLTKQLLTFSKGGAPVKERVRLDTLIEDIVRFDLSGSNVKPEFATVEHLWPAEVDKGQIQQVLSNLTINAKQAMPDGGCLRVSMENAAIAKDQVPGLAKGKYVKITVADEGTGIDRKHLGRIFDPYFTTKQAGNGLGLATVYAITKNHGGSIGVASEVGKGTVFTMYLPAMDADRPAQTRQRPKPAETGAQHAKILVMDDEEMICELVSKMLVRSGFSVETATEGRQAVDMYRRAKAAGDGFDVVIMDLTVPGGLGGKEAIQDILAIDPDARAIVSSGYANDPVMADYAAYGFSGIVAKPYTVDKLLDVLNRVLTA